MEADIFLRCIMILAYKLVDTVGFGIVIRQFGILNDTVISCGFFLHLIMEIKPGGAAFCNEYLGCADSPVQVADGLIGGILVV